MKIVLLMLGMAVCLVAPQLAVCDNLPFNATCEVKQLKENLFRIDVQCANIAAFRKRDSAPETISNILTVHAAQVAVERGYQYFRVLESWVTRGEWSTAERHKRTMIIRLTADPNDLEARWVIDTFGPSLAQKK